MPHLDEGTIHAWLDGALAPDEAAAVESHVAECAECSSAVAEARGLIAASSRILSALDNVPGGVIPMPVASDRPVVSAPPEASRWGRPRPWRAYMVRAAAVLLLAVGVRAAFRSDRAPTDVAASRQAAGPESAPPAASDEAGAREKMAAESSPVAAPVRGSASAPPPVVAAVQRPVSPGEAGAAKRTEKIAGAIGTAAGAAVPERDLARDAVAQMASVSAQPPAAPRPEVGAMSASTRANAAGGLSMKSARVAEPRSADEAKERSTPVSGSPPLRLVQGWTVVATSVETTPDGTSRRTVYEVRPEVRVELEERMPASALTDAVARADAPQTFAAKPQDRRMRDAAAPSAAPAAPAPRVELESANAPAIHWTSATGTELTLRGPLSSAELQALRKRIPEG